MPLRLALATPDLRRLQAAWAAAATGGWAFMVALAVYAYGEGGAAAVGIAALARMVPAGLVAPLLGRVADRRSRRDVLLASTLARAALLGTLALAAALHAFPLVLVLAALFTVAQAAHKPAQAALIPRLSTHAEAANALWTTIDNAAFILGALVETAGITRLQRLTRDQHRVRAFAALESTYWLTTGAGAMLAPLLIHAIGVRGALMVAGAALPLTLLATRLVPLKVATAVRPAAV